MAKKITQKNEKVAIVGFAPSWDLAPFDDLDFDIWGLNELYLQTGDRRFTAWFEVHDPYSPSKNTPKHHEWMRVNKMPLYMQKHYDEFPASLPFPRQEVKDMVNQFMIQDKPGSLYTDFSNQITWMILMAIYQGYKEIHIYGVDMAQQSEYAWQRASCQFSIGLALGKGIKILIPTNSELCKYTKDYGFETDNQPRHMKKTRIKSLERSILGYKSQIADVEYQYSEKHKAFETLKQNVQDSLIKIGDELVKLSVMTTGNEEYIKFLEGMPPTMDEIMAKKEGLLIKIKEQNATLLENIPRLEEQAKKIKDQLERESKLDFMNKKTLEETKIDFERRINIAIGSIGECKYDLDNNKV